MGTASPGPIIMESILPAREYAAVELERRQILRVVDIEGQQVLDLVGFGADRTEKLYTNRCRPMLTIVEDTVGVHHSGGGFCSEESNFIRYGVHDTRNCADNLTRAVAPFGLARATSSTTPASTSS